MSTNILNEDRVSFKDLEKAIFEIYCEAARGMTVSILQALDEKLAKERDRSRYRDKGYRKTTIKTVYGEVEYKRHVYITKTEEGLNAAVYLLDEEIGMDKIGLISTNLAEKIGSIVTGTPFRKTSTQVSETTGQTISHSGVWNFVQMLGEKLESEEETLIQEFYAEKTRGKKAVQMLFEEKDGIWLKHQKNGGKKAPKMEVKIGTIYEGWKADTGKRSVLSGKTVLAGIESSDTFNEKMEAKIQSIYDPEKIERRALNGDGGDWIKDEYDADTIQQLDRFHVKKAIREKVSYTDARNTMLDMLRRNKSEELVEYAQIYCDSIGPDDEIQDEQDAKDLRDYLFNHEGELALYNSRGIDLPVAPEGIIYRNMGVQENQNCTVIGLRMKGKRKRWGRRGANNMIRLLYYKENNDLIGAIDRYTDGEILIEPIRDKLKMPLSSAKAMRGESSRNKYIDIFNVHLPITDSCNTRTADVFRRLGY